MTTRETIGVLGFSARAAAFSVLRAGCVPIAADAFADADLRRVASVSKVANYPAGLADWLARQTADRPDLRWLYTGGLENHPKLLARLARCGQLAGIGVQPVRRTRSPLRLAAWLADAGLAMPETQRRPLGLPTNGAWLKKKRRSAGGSGVSPWTGGPTTPGTYYQERVAGIPASAVYVAHRNGAVCYGVTGQLTGASWTGAQGFGYGGSIGPWPIGDRLKEQIERVGDVVAGAAGLRGLFGVDFILARDTAWTLELNPRYTASVEVLERSGLPPAIELHMSACHGEVVRAPVPKASFHGKAVLYATGDLQIDHPFSQRFLSESSDWRTAAWADIPAGGTVVAARQPVLTAFASGASCEEVEERLQQQARIVQERLKPLGSRSCN